MNDTFEKPGSPVDLSNRKMTREEIVRAVTEPVEEKTGRKRLVVIPTEVTETIDFEQIAQGLNVEPDSKRYQILKVLCEEKNAGIVEIKVLIKRMEEMSATQLDILKVLCRRRAFTCKAILSAIAPIRKFGEDRVLALRAFIDLDGVGPGPLGRFFKTALAQGSLKELGKEGLEQEIREKAMRPDQVTCFYNICKGVPQISHGTAVTLLPRVRQLKPQHTLFLNTFLKNEVVFGSKPINDDTIAGLVNLFLSLPELKDDQRFKKLVKKLSRKPDGVKKDFKQLVGILKGELEKEASGNGLTSGIRKLFS